MTKELRELKKNKSSKRYKHRTHTERLQRQCVIYNFTMQTHIKPINIQMMKGKKEHSGGTTKNTSKINKTNDKSTWPQYSASQ